MAKSYVDVIGITKGESPRVLATFEDRKDANWHVNNTFANEDKCLVKSTKTKGDKFVSNDVAQDRDGYILSTATMEITNLDKLTITTEESTILDFIQKGILDKKSSLNKVVDVNTDDVNYKSVQVIHNENDAFPHSKVKKKLEEDLIQGFIGEEDTVEEQENEGEQEKEEDTKDSGKDKKEEPKKATKVMYFSHEGSDGVFKVQKGESLDFLDRDIFNQLTKKEYDKLLKQQEEEDAEAEEESEEFEEENDSEETDSGEVEESEEEVDTEEEDDSEEDDNEEESEEEDDEGEENDTDEDDFEELEEIEEDDSDENEEEDAEEEDGDEDEDDDEDGDDDEELSDEELSDVFEDVED